MIITVWIVSYGRFFVIVPARTDWREARREAVAKLNEGKRPWARIKLTDIPREAVKEHRSIAGGGIVVSRV